MSHESLGWPWPRDGRRLLFAGVLIGAALGMLSAIMFAAGWLKEAGRRTAAATNRAEIAEERAAKVEALLDPAREAIEFTEIFRTLGVSAEELARAAWTVRCFPLISSRLDRCQETAP